MHGKTLKFSSIIIALISYMKTRLNSTRYRNNAILSEELVVSDRNFNKQICNSKQKTLDLQSSSSSSKSSSKSSAAALVQLVPRQCPQLQLNTHGHVFYMCIACYYNQTSSCASQYVTMLLVTAEGGS